MDVADEAERVEALFREAALSRFRGDAAMLGCGALLGPLLCAECGQGVPEARRAAVPGAERCVECQSVLEARGGAARAGRWAA